MKTKSQAKARTSTGSVASGLALVAKASALFSTAGRLSAVDRRHAVKLKRGALEMVPTIAHIATKFAVELPGMPIADMQSNVAYVQQLETLIGAVSAFYATLRDEKIRANAETWSTASATYVMLKRAAQVDPNIANELASVQKWFQQVSRGKRAASDGAPVPATSAQASTTPAPAAVAPKPVAAPAAASVTSVPAAPVTPVSAAPVNGTAS